MSEKKEKHRIVVYHEDCIDGQASAWVLHQNWLALKEKDLNITYVAYGHHHPTDAEQNILNLLTSDTEIYFADVVPRPEFLDTLLKPNQNKGAKLKSIHIFDHHKTAAKSLKEYKKPLYSNTTQPTLNIHIDEKAPSASGLIWKKYFPAKTEPAFLKMINKMDLSEDLKTVEDFSAAALIDSLDTSTIAAAFNTCNKLSKITKKEMVFKGRKIYNDQQNRIKKLSHHLMYTDITLLPNSPELSVPIINANVQNFGRSITKYLQDLGGKSASDVAFAWYVRENGAVTMSIRSRGAPDASKIAEHLSKEFNVRGGGHPTSAALQFPSLQKFCQSISLKSHIEIKEIQRVNKKKKHAPGH